MASPETSSTDPVPPRINWLRFWIVFLLGPVVCVLLARFRDSGLVSMMILMGNPVTALICGMETAPRRYSATKRTGAILALAVVYFVFETVMSVQGCTMATKARGPMN
jgi:hypothetical protein